MSCQFCQIPTETNKVQINILEPPFPDKLNPKLFYNGSAYLSTKRPMVYKYFDCLLFKLELEDGLLKVSRPMRDSAIYVSGFLQIQMYDKDNKELDPIDRYQIDFPATPGETRYNNEYSTNQYAFQRVEHENPTNNCEFTPHPRQCYVAVQLILLTVDGHVSLIPVREQRLKTKGYAYIECINGSVRVYKKSLSDASSYFEKLFSGRKLMKYQVDIDLIDLMHLLSTLPPFNYKIRTGAIYGAIRRISEQLLCCKLAEFCDRFMQVVSSATPLGASFMAFEGEVEYEEDLYVRTRALTHRNMLAEEMKQQRWNLYLAVWRGGYEHPEEVEETEYAPCHLLSR